MLEKYEPVCYELLRPAQVKALREKCPIAYVPFGSLEWHGLHLPLGTDSLKAHAICCEAALKHGGVVLPPVYQGLLGFVNWGPKGWEGYTLGSNEETTPEIVMTGIGRALAQSDWKVIVGVTGHDVDRQRDAMQRGIDAAVKGKKATGFAVMEGEGHKKSEAIPLQMDHAAAWETSCMMYAYPDKVDLDELRKQPLSGEENLSMGGPEGIGGRNPLKYSSAELGIAIVEAMGDIIGARAVAALAELRKKAG